MNTHDPIDLLFGGMEKLGPGSNADTLHVLRLLPRRAFRVIVDAGCGSGRQTLVLARELGLLIHAVDLHEPFLADLVRRAREAGIGHLVKTHCMDMKNIPDTFQQIDLLWAEGSAYNIGFSNALNAWAPAVRRDGFAVVSELVWLRGQVPDVVRNFFRAGYPDMQSIPGILEVAENAGFKVLATHTLPNDAWVENYYDTLEPRAKALASHSDSSVRDFAVETLDEIEIFRASEDSYSYTFLVLQRA